MNKHNNTSFQTNNLSQAKDFSKRYSRQIILPQIGLIGQSKINSAHVTIIGAGALGSVAAELLTRSGVGKITVIDRDIVELSNLQRQSLYTVSDIGKSKIEALTFHLKNINPLIKIDSFCRHLNCDNVKELIPINCDIILDCTDNISTRKLIDIFCQKNSLFWVYAAAIKTSGYVALLDGKKFTLNSFLQENSFGETCSSVGVLSTITHLIATVQTNLALQKILTDSSKNNCSGNYPPNLGKLFSFDIWKMQFRTFNLKPTATPKIELKYPLENRISKFCTTGIFQILPTNNSSKLDLNALATNLKKTFPSSKTLLFENFIKVDGNYFFNDKRALIKAKNKAGALTLYDKLIGN